MDKINQDYGNLSLSDLLRPAINLAENGYVVADVIADMWKREAEKLKKDKDCKELFLKEMNHIRQEKFIFKLL